MTIQISANFRFLQISDFKFQISSTNSNFKKFQISEFSVPALAGSSLILHDRGAKTLKGRTLKSEIFNLKSELSHSLHVGGIQDRPPALPL